MAPETGNDSVLAIAWLGFTISWLVMLYFGLKRGRRGIDCITLVALLNYINYSLIPTELMLGFETVYELYSRE